MEDLDLDKVVVLLPSEELVALVLVLPHMVEVELLLLVVQLVQKAVNLEDFFMVVMVWLLAVVLVTLTKVVEAVDQDGMVVVVLVIMNVVGLKQVEAVAVRVMDAQHMQTSPGQ